MKRLLPCLFLSLPLFGQDWNDLQVWEKIPSARRLITPVELKANVSLPAHVIAPQGELTLFADFAHPKEADEYHQRHIPLYLINRTTGQSSITMATVESAIKLEYQKPDGSWARADADPGGRCGLRMWDHALAPGEHFAFQGYRASKGIKAKVRYACCTPGSQLVSNTGEGEYLIIDAEGSKWDMSGTNAVPRTLFDEIRLQPSKDSLAELVAACTLLRVFGPVPDLHRFLGQRIQELQQADEPTKNSMAALSALRSLKEQPRNAEAWQYQALARRCLEALNSTSKAPPEFGSPESVPKLIWDVLEELVTMETESRHVKIQPTEKSPPSFWRAVFELAAARIIHSPESIRQPMAELLGVSAYADEFLKDAAWEPMLISSTPYVRSLAAATLARRGLRARLLEISPRLEPDAQISILCALAREQPRLSADAEDSEAIFWKLCIAKYPRAAIAAITPSEHESIRIESPYHALVHQSLREFWLEEAMKERDKKDDRQFGSDWRDTQNELEFFASYKNKEDIPLFLELLKHRGFVIEHRPDADPGTQIRFYPLRILAAKALLDLGQNIPPNTSIINQVSTPPPKPE